MCSNRLSTAMILDPEMPAVEVGYGDAATVIVLYLPSGEDLANLSRLARGGRRVIAVVNALAADQRDALSAVQGVTFIRNERNLGLARALNQGLEAAMAEGAGYVLLLDQDSRPSDDMIGQLAAAAAAIERSGRRLACVAPVLKDRKSQARDPADPINTIARTTTSPTTFATSGTLITKRAWDEVGPMWDALFIDGIDHEWCFRARSHGFETVLVSDVVMDHDMGDLAVNVFGRFRPVHRSPIRHYFIVRNTLWIVRRRYIPLGWRLREFVKLTYRCPIYVLVSRDKARSIAAMAGAILDGILGSAVRQPI